MGPPHEGLIRRPILRKGAWYKTYLAAHFSGVNINIIHARLVYLLTCLI